MNAHVRRLIGLVLSSSVLVGCGAPEALRVEDGAFDLVIARR
jgi:hypothetical protein